jgi:hypothetical protein
MMDGDHFKTMVEEKLDHYCGRHDKCPDKTVCDQFVHIENQEAMKAFMVCVFFTYNFKAHLVFFCRAVLQVQDG